MSKLSEFYQTAQNEALAALESMYDVTECVADDPDFPINITAKEKWTVRKVQTKVSSTKTINLVVAIPPIYPDDLPKIYLTKSDFEELPQLPHVDNNRFICNRDPEVVFINENKPGEALIELVQIAVNEILLPGIKGTNKLEVSREFLAYWNSNYANRFISIVPPPADICQLNVLQLRSRVFNSFYFIANNPQELKDWLTSFKVEVEKDTSWKALNLPVPNPMPFPFPSTNSEILRFITTCGAKYVEAFDKFLCTDQDNLVVFFSHYIDDESIWYGVKLRQWPEHISHGFSALSKVPLKVRIMKTANRSVKRIAIERVDRDRLFNRIGLRLEERIRTIRICIIGCGSVGSSVAYALAKSGIDNFTLIDNDMLSIENVARHECGAVDAVNFPPKAKALQLRLKSHFPYIFCDAIDSDILELMAKSKGITENFDLIIVAVGKRGVERRLNSLAYTGEIKAPVAFLWIEPYGIAGHLVYVNSKNHGCLNCCFEDNGEFKFAVASQNDSLNMREAGCQSTFLPYSHLDIQQFIAYGCRQLIGLLVEEPKINIRFSWIGDKESFMSQGYSINESWAGIPSFRTYSRPIVPSATCKVCK